MNETTPVQTNAADETQVQHAQDRQDDALKRELADDRETLRDYDARRRAFEDLMPLFEDIRNGDLEGVFRMLGRREVALVKFRRWMRHPELCSQLLTEGLKRSADEEKLRRARHTRRST